MVEKKWYAERDDNGDWAVWEDDFPNEPWKVCVIAALIPDGEKLNAELIASVPELKRQRDEAKYLIEALLENDFLTQINFNDIEGAIYRCNFCSGSGGHKSFEHKADCIVRQARTFIANAEQSS